MEHQYTRMADVAAAAGVSTTTVSNVLNCPHRVGAETRDTVYETIRRLNYVPNTHAAALRRKRADKPPEAEAPTAGDRTPSRKDEKTSRQKNVSAADSTAGPTPTDKLSGWASLVEGETLHVNIADQELGTGVVSAVMPDGSAVWLVMEDGTGRKMYLADDKVALRSQE